MIMYREILYTDHGYKINHDTDASVYFYLIKFYSEHNTRGPMSVSM